MKFSDSTLSVLKNFSEINPSIMFRPGQTLRTISPQKTIMASADVEDTFDSSAAVYDLSRFLSTLSLFDSADIIFEADRFRIKSATGKAQTTYTYASENMIVTPPAKDFEIPSVVATVSVKSDELKKVLRAVGVLQLSEIQFAFDGNDVTLSAVDSKNPTSDTYSTSLDVAELPSKPFKILIKSENMKLVDADYTVSLSSQGITHFKSKSVQYWIACEAK